MKSEIFGIKKSVAVSALFSLSLIVIVSCGFADENRKAPKQATDSAVAVNADNPNSSTANKTDDPKPENSAALKMTKLADVKKADTKNAGLKATRPGSANNAKPVAAATQQTKTLKQAYANYFPIGAAIEPKDFVNNKPVTDLILREFSSITAANQMKPTYLEAKEGVFTWKNGDAVADFAMNNGLKLRGHCLVWPQQMPKWMYRDGNKAASKELLLSRLKTYITTVVTHYKGKAYCWDVVNEAIPYIGPDPLDNRVDSLYVIAGEDYIAKAFEYAHAADPNAQLYYNDNSFEWSKKRDKIYNYLKKLKSQGVPIDGVGLQAHWGIEGISEEYLQQTIDMFSSIGLKVQLTELDISIYPKKQFGRIMNAASLKSMSDAYSPSIQDKQADVYNTIFKVCRKNKGKVTGVTLWSAYDWANQLSRKLGKKNYPYLFDDKLAPKKAYFKVLNFNN
jgi:endo-1,4-beta-xylanase